MVNELLLNNATQLRKLLRSKAISATELMKVHIDHIETVDVHVNAMVTRCFDKALLSAKRLDDDGNFEPLLAGIPIPHKDLVATKGIRTTFGSPLFKNLVPDHNDYIIERMINAGAISIGKTNVPEFGAGSHTFNRVFGPARNPYDFERTCGGSSGGAAVALATRMACLADGSDLGGSLRNPGAFCNVIGFRPTTNVLPPNLTGNHALNLASLGPMARTIDDVALFFEALLGNESNPDYSDVESVSLTDCRIAFTEDFGDLPVDTNIKQRVREVATTLADAGAQVTEATIDFRDARQIFHALRGWSFKNRYNNLSDWEKVELKPTILWNLAYGQALTEEDMNEVQGQREALRQRTRAFFEEYDLLLGPTTQVLPFPIPIDWVREIEGVQMDTYIDWMESCSWVTTTECPALSMPAGFIDDLPVGVQLIGPHGTDQRLLGLSKSIETLVSSAHVLPKFLCGD